ncbi:MAG: GAF domain-containing sensor histidine kinase [Bacteroidota bacterium]
MLLEDLLTDTAAEPHGSAAPQGIGDQHLETILTVVRKINTSLVLSDVLTLVLDEAIRIAAAERGFLMLANAEHRLDFAVGRTASGSSIEASNFRVSSTVLNDVYTMGESLCIESALQDARFERKESVMDLELQTILCSPLRTIDETIGVIYVDSKFIQPVDRAEILSLFEILAGQAAIAIKNARLYENLQKAYHDLSQANDQIVKFERMATKGEMIAEVSHELKNMVGILLMSHELLGRRLAKLSDEKGQQFLSQAMKSAERILGFTEALQSREQAKGNMVRRDPNRVMQDFVDFVRALPRFRGCKITVLPGNAVPEVSLDIDQIQQVLLNLLMNAIQARADASVVLTSAYEESEGLVTIAVSDNGPGIEDAVLERLFKEKVTTKPDGHGYGLRVCEQVLAHHGGSITVQSRLHEGTKFELKIPVVL